MMRKDRPVTPDGRYFVARGILRRCTNPKLPPSERRALIKKLMQARMARPSATTDAEVEEVRERIETVKIALGEAGPVWWSDGTQDRSGQHPTATEYKTWWAALPDDLKQRGEIE